MRKVLSIYLPNWATELVRRRELRACRAGALHEEATKRRSDEATQGKDRQGTKCAASPFIAPSLRRSVAPASAILLTRETHGRTIVARRCELAAAAGVTEGMCLTDARALLGDRPLHIEPHQPVRDRRRLEKLADWALRFAPLVQADGDDGLLMDVTGCGRIYGGQKRVVRHIAGAIERLGFTVHAALASSVGAAWAMARYGAPQRKHWFVVADDRVAEWLAPLPLAALRIDEPTQVALHEVAVDTIGELLAIDRGELADRFDDALLRRLDEALGGSFEPIDPAEPVNIPGVERRFAGPVKQVEAIELTVRGLLDLLAVELARGGVGARVIEMTVERYDAPPLKEQVTLSRPSVDAAHFWTLWAPKVERLNLGHGVEMIRLAAVQTQRLDHDQEAIWADDPTRRAAPARHGQEALGRLVDRMISRLGPEHVCRVRVIETHVPEAAFAHEPWDSPPPLPRRETSGGAGVRVKISTTTRANSQRETSLIAADRPSQLFPRSRRVEVVCLSPDGPVVSMRDGPRHSRMVTSIGPERIAGRWWLLSDPTAAVPVRDYFKAQDEQGAWWWIYRENDSSRWWVQGGWN